MRAELEPSAAATSAPRPAVAPTSAVPAPSAMPVAAAAPTPATTPEALDLGSLGAKVAGRAAARTVRRPGFWIAVAAAAALLYLLFR